MGVVKGQYKPRVQTYSFFKLVKALSLQLSGARSPKVASLGLRGG